MVYNNCEGIERISSKKAISKLTGLRKQYAEYEYNYRYNGGLESDEEFLNYDEWIDKNFDC